MGFWRWIKGLHRHKWISYGHGYEWCPKCDKLTRSYGDFTWDASIRQVREDMVHTLQEIAYLESQSPNKLFLKQKEKDQKIRRLRNLYEILKTHSDGWEP